MGKTILATPNMVGSMLCVDCHKQNKQKKNLKVSKTSTVRIILIKGIHFSL